MNKIPELKIEYLNVKELTPYTNNAREHREEDVNVIKESIKKFGFSDPIGIWHDDKTGVNYVVEGHGRLMAAKELKIDKVPCIKLNHLNDEERKAYGLVHNRSAELSEWNFENLNFEIEQLSNNFDFNELGFSSFLNDDEIIDDSDFDLKEHDKKEKEIICPHCGGKILI